MCKIIVLISILSVKCLSQSIEIGIGFAPYDIGSSTFTKIETEIETEDYMEKIFSYFFTIEASTDTNLKYVIIDSSFTFKLNELKNYFYGFGRLETIRLLLISKKANVSIKPILEDRKRNKTLKEIAEKYHLNYIDDVWLPSKQIYNLIFEEKLE